jgi:glycosyltransferase involved in cell wall biosynthesis
MRVVVVEPDGHGRTSGGYLYNLRLAEHGAFELVRVTPGIPAQLEGLRGSKMDLILADSLFLEARGLAPFLALREGATRVGVLLHAFPSFIRRASDRATLERELPLVPLASELEAIAHLDLVVTPGPYVARVLSAAGSRVPCVVCSPGVDSAPENSAAATPSVTVRLLAIANLTPAKGIPDALEALAMVRDLPWQLTLIGALDGDPAHVAALRELIRQRGLAGRVHFRGATSHAETLAELRASHLLVIPSYTENCPLVALEAAKAGVPVVGYAAGGLPDLVEHEVTGLLVPVLDVPSLAGALRNVLASGSERDRLARGAAARGRTLLTWREAASAFQRVLLPYQK